MSTVGNTVLTLTDWAKRIDPDGKIDKIVELLSQSNQILDDMLFMEGNLPTGHRTTVRTGLPTVYWRTLNKGIQPSKSRTAQIDEGTGILEAWSNVDEELASLNGSVNAFRLSEAEAFIEAMNQEMASTLIYGNSSVSPEEFNGLAIRYADKGAASGQNIIDAGGTGSDNTSIWMVCWGASTVHGIFPKGSKAGISHRDLGLKTVNAGIDGEQMMAYQDQWKWKTGLALRDWRYVVRIANIDVSDLNTGSPADLTALMIKAIHRLPSEGVGKCVFYMNRTVMQYLDLQRRDAVKDGGQLSYEVVDGKRIMTFRGFPMRKVDAILETEAQVV